MEEKCLMILVNKLQRNNKRLTMKINRLERKVQQLENNSIGIADLERYLEGLDLLS